MRHKRRGFTLVEIMTAVAIIAILAGMLFLGAKHISASARAKKTLVLLKNLENMLTEFESRGGRMDNLTGQYNKPPFNGQEIMPKGVVADDSAYSNTDLNAANGALKHTQNVMLALTSVPENKAILDKLPPETFMKQQGSNQLVPGPILLDAWNSPILFAPGRVSPDVANWGATGMYVTNDPKSPNKSDLSKWKASFQPADGKGLFISAGLDSDFSQGDDNLYSYEK